MKGNSIRSRMISAFRASSIMQLLNVFIQVATVPTYIYFWGVNSYGDWLVLTTIPSYLMMSDLGFLNLAAVQMTLATSKNDRINAILIFHGTLVFILLISFLLLTVLSICFFIDINKWFNILTISNVDCKSIIFILAVSVIVSLQTGVLSAVFRSDGKYIIGIWISIFSKCIEFLSVITGLFLNAGAIEISIIILFVRVFIFFIYFYFIKLHFKWLNFNFKFNINSFYKIKSMIIPSIAYMGFPLGNMIKNQGILMLVSSALGPIAVVLLTTTRTLVNSTSQFIGVIHGSAQIELSSAYASYNINVARNLNRFTAQISVWLSAAICIFLCIFGLNIINIWTLDKVSIPPIFFYLMALVGFINSFWLTFFIVPNAVNRHIKISGLFIFSTILSLLITNLLLPHFNIYAIPISLFFIDILMIPFTLYINLQILEDSFTSFIKIIFTPPINNIIKLLKT